MERTKAYVIWAEKSWDNHEDYEAHLDGNSTLLLGVRSDRKEAEEKIKGYMNAIKHYLEATLRRIRVRETLTQYPPANSLDDYYVGEIEHSSDKSKEWSISWDFGDFDERLKITYNEFELDEENKYYLERLFNEAL